LINMLFGINMILDPMRKKVPFVIRKISGSTNLVNITFNEL
jgi:hypothetical protein